MKRRRILAVAAAAASAAALGPRVARAEPLNDDEYARLERGEVVGRPVDVEIEGLSYFGVVSYAVVDSSVSEVTKVLMDPAAYTEVLPRALDSVVVDRKGPLVYVRLTQGGKLGTASYVVVIKHDPEGTVRFWLDKARPHDIGDCWGRYVIEPITPHQSLIRWGALLHLEAGMVKMLFTELIRGYAMSAPALLRIYLSKHAR